MRSSRSRGRSSPTRRRGAHPGRPMTSPAIGAVEVSKLLGLDHPPTDEQTAVIEAPLGPAVVIAGAGSGKTETMAARVGWVVATRLVTPNAVLGLTFTRKAAAELGRRIRRRLAQWRVALASGARGGARGTPHTPAVL